MTTIETPSVIRRLWKSVLALGVLNLLLGTVVLIWPGDSIVVASVVFGVYLLVSGIAQAVGAFTVDTSPGSRALFFIGGALSVVLGCLAFRDFNNGASVWMLATWIGVGLYSRVSPRPCWRSRFRNCPSGAGTSLSGS
jgi:uncharacterized membrane protein HdeD (DUF308 family)